MQFYTSMCQRETASRSVDLCALPGHLRIHDHPRYKSAISMTVQVPTTLPFLAGWDG